MPRMELRQALREIRRIERLVWRFVSSKDDEAAFLDGLADTRTQESSFLSDWFVSRAAKAVEGPYGQAWRVRRPAIWSSHPAVFFALVLPNGECVATFDPPTCMDLAPFVMRHAVQRLFSSKGRRFPADLSEPALAQAVWDLVWVHPPYFTPTEGWPPGANPVLRQEAGVLEVPGRWAEEESPGSISLHWDARRLWLVL